MRRLGRQASILRPGARFDRRTARELGKASERRCPAIADVELVGDVFDVYGRFIGEVVVDTPGPGTVHINEHLLAAGFAFPAIYTSASRIQAERCLHLAREARSNGRGIWRSYTSELQFDADLVHRHKEEADERGPVILPKLFRRAAVWWVKNGDIRGLKTMLSKNKPAIRSCRWSTSSTKGPAGLETENLATFLSGDSWCR